MKFSISSPINLNSPQHYVNVPHVFTQPTDPFHSSLPTNAYPSNNVCCESIEDGTCLHSDCHHIHRNNNANIIEEEGFVMSVDALNGPSIQGENKNDISLVPRNNINFEGLNSMQPHPHSLSLQNLAKQSSSFIHHQPTPLLTTLLPPTSSTINNMMNDVAMTTSSSATFSVLRNASPSHLLPASLHSNLTSSHMVVGEGDMRCQEERKPFVVGNFDQIRDDSVSMTTFENNHCSTLLF